MHDGPRKEDIVDLSADPRVDSLAKAVGGGRAVGIALCHVANQADRDAMVIRLHLADDHLRVPLLKLFESYDDGVLSDGKKHNIIDGIHDLLMEDGERFSRRPLQ